jgi:FMN phosphatase YigB (HAD superfamily)
MKTILVDAYNTLVKEDGLDTEMLEMLEKFPNDKIILTNADEEKQVEL